jgi:8-oxo-dGTP diphosphatase
MIPSSKLFFKEITRQSISGFTQMEHKFRNPLVTVDIVIEINDGIVLIERKNPPHGWALPGGFVDYGESLEATAVREAKEETSLDVKLYEQFHTYSDPDRDPRHHSITTVYIAKGTGIPKAEDDAKRMGVFTEQALPAPIVFDHEKIIADYFQYKKGRLKRDIFRVQ